jgi:uncharacterized protein YndB with AHSA1/START domain
MGTQIGLTKDAGWEIGVSRTLPHPPEDVWAFLTSPEGVRLWLGAGAKLGDAKGAAYRTTSGTVGEVRSFRPGDRLRVTWRPKDWDHESTLQVTVSTPRSGGGTTVRFHQERLADADERELQRGHWQSVMDELERALA